MSNEENSNESENIGDKVEEAIDRVEDVVEETIETASEAIEKSSAGIMSKITDLKESNPKVFYGAVGALVVIILAMFMMGGGDKKHLPIAKKVDLASGQTYVLKGVNTFDPDATVRLVAVPGSIAAYDDSEETEKGDPCKHIAQGTRVKLIQMQEAFGKAKFVEVEITEGDCAGRKGWTVSNNLN